MAVKTRLTTFPAALIQVSLIFISLYTVSFYSYTYFYTIVQVASVVVTFGIFSVVWNSRKHLDNNYILFIGIAYLFIGSLDLLHILEFEVPLNAAASEHTATGLWLGARFLSAISLAIAPAFINRRVKPVAVLGAYTLVFVVVLLAVYYWGIFPPPTLTGAELNTFTVGSELVISYFLFVALVELYLKRKEFSKRVVSLLSLAIMAMIGSELVFTFYLDANRTLNIIGHYLRIIAFYLSYLSIIEMALRKPYDIIFKNLQESKQLIQRARDNAVAIVETVREPLVVVDRQARVQSANQAFYETFKLSPAETLHKEFYSLGGGQWDIAGLRQRINELLMRGKAFTGYEVEQDFPEIGHRSMLVNGSQIYQKEFSQGVALIAIEDITQEKRARQNIEQLNVSLKRYASELAAANRELEAFNYSVSHDLRAPLRSTDGFSLALLEDYSDRLDETGRDYLRRIRAASQRMGKLIDDLLMLSRLSRHSFEKRMVDISAVANEVVKEMYQRYPQRAVETEIEPNVHGEADASLLRIALENLFDNAWKFTGKQPGARVAFGVADVDGQGAYFVRDNGVGFDMAFIDKLFVPFQRLHSPEEFAGTGIGLVTVQRIIHRHGGRIWAESSPGVGTTFYFTLG